MPEIKIQCPISGVEIVHAIPGRVRLSCLRKAQITQTSHKSPQTLQYLSKQIEQQKGIKKIEINPQTKSALILFDEKVLPLQTLLLILQTMGVEDARHTPAIPLSEPLEVATRALSSASHLDTVIPYMVGMVLTQQLGITGLPALPFYLLAAGTTKQVLEEYSETEPPHTPSPEYRLAHSVPGRLRYEIKRLVEDEVYARRLERRVRDIPGITGVRINRSNASLVVLYNRRISSLEQIKALIDQAIHPTPVAPKPDSAVHIPDSRGNAEVMTPSHRDARVPTPEPATGFWGQYKPPAMKMCLAFLTRL